MSSEEVFVVEVRAYLNGATCKHPSQGLAPGLPASISCTLQVFPKEKHNCLIGPVK